MNEAQKKMVPLGGLNQDTIIIKTTLYDLIEAVEAEVSPDEQEMIPVAVTHILNSRQIRPGPKSKTRKNFASCNHHFLSSNFDEVIKTEGRI